MNIKLCLGDDIRRVLFKETHYGGLVACVTNLFPELKGFQLRYRDHENDNVTLSNDEDFQFAMKTHARSCAGSLLRIYVLPSSKISPPSLPPVPVATTTTLVPIPTRQEVWRSVMRDVRREGAKRSLRAQRKAAWRSVMRDVRREGQKRSLASRRKPESSKIAKTFQETTGVRRAVLSEIVKVKGTAFLDERRTAKRREHLNLRANRATRLQGRAGLLQEITQAGGYKYLQNKQETPVNEKAEVSRRSLLLESIRSHVRNTNNKRCSTATPKALPPPPPRPSNNWFYGCARPTRSAFFHRAVLRSIRRRGAQLRSIHESQVVEQVKRQPPMYSNSNIAGCLEKLDEMGFKDIKLNFDLTKQHRCDMVKIVRDLLC